MKEFLNDDLFHVIDDAQVVLRSKGTYYQRKVYRRGNRLYAGHGGGFVRIGGHEATSNPNVSWEALDLPQNMKLGFDEIRNPTITIIAQPLKEAA